MSDFLKKHIERFISLDDGEYLAISKFFERQEVKKKRNLLVEGKICQANYFVEKGLLRLFFVNDNGIEQTTQFAMENWWMADYTSFQLQKPSEFYIQTVENSSVLLLSYAAQEQLLQQHPKMERYYRLLHQRAHAAAQFRVRYLYNNSKEEHYRMFNARYPQFANRIPQYLLASFLGLTPEYLSEIKRKEKS
jgi:CRP/FNR family transcriptional regulator, anaerobic regulatory protein